MANTTIRMASYNWDHLQPLATGDVKPDVVVAQQIGRRGCGGRGGRDGC